MAARQHGECTEDVLQKDREQCKLLHTRGYSIETQTRHEINPTSMTFEPIFNGGGLVVEKSSHRLQGRFHSSLLPLHASRLNEDDTQYRLHPEKWRELHTRGGTVFRKSEQQRTLPSVKAVHSTNFTRIFNSDSDKNGDSVNGGERWHGRTQVRCKKDAEWVALYDADVTAWLRVDRLNWLATTSDGEPKKVNDTHALKAGVNRHGKTATTPVQRPMHSDSCWPNSQVVTRTPWGDAHLAMLTALQDATSPRPNPLSPPPLGDQHAFWWRFLRQYVVRVYEGLTHGVG